MSNKSSCCNAPLLSGVQCECCGADERKFELSDWEKKNLKDKKILQEIRNGEVN